MDNVKTGELIRRLRMEKRLTQRQLAEQLHVSDKTVSKWERGLGSPELSLISGLSQILGIDTESLLSGRLDRNELPGGDMRKLRIYVCPSCGNLLTSVTEASVVCCGRKLQALVPVRASGEERLSVRIIENDFFISSEHEMTREHHIAFAAFLTDDTVLLKKLYPEWDLQLRIPFFAHGRLLWYCTRHGCFYQEL